MGSSGLTTLQLLLAALGAVAGESRPEQAEEVGKLLLNEGKHATGDLRFKILPGEHDRPAFKQILGGDGTSPGTEGIHGAYDYFMGEIRKWVQAEKSADQQALMLDALQEACEGLLQVVSIQLDGSSDAQVIFETLNSRGADLTSLDLAKNAIFRLAERSRLRRERSRSCTQPTGSRRWAMPTTGWKPYGRAATTTSAPTCSSCTG